MAEGMGYESLGVDHLKLPGKDDGWIQPRHARTDKYMEYVNIAISLISAIVGALIAVLAEPLRCWFSRSVVRLVFRPNIEFGRGCVFLTGTTHPNVTAKYVRILVECSSKWGIVARGCRPYLTRIERIEPEYRVLHTDPLPLSWAQMSDVPLDIHSQMKFYFDVVAVDNSENRLRPQTIVAPEVWTPLLEQPGKYRFSAVVCGENINPVQVEVTFEWVGDFDSLTENSFTSGNA